MLVNLAPVCYKLVANKDFRIMMEELKNYVEIRITMKIRKKYENPHLCYMWMQNYENLHNLLSNADFFTLVLKSTYW